MIKAEDLRVGNIIASSNHDRLVIVSYHEIRHATINEDNPYIGIPVTSEILLKCGFTWRNSAHNILDFGDSFVLYLDNGFRYKDYPFTKVETLHHAQNLCFALTGEELPTSSLTAPPPLT
jgi:hypothetical protein